MHNTQHEPWAGPVQTLILGSPQTLLMTRSSSVLSPGICPGLAGEEWTEIVRNRSCRK